MNTCNTANPKNCCGCQGVNVFRRGIKRTCMLKNVDIIKPTQCNALDIFAIEKGVEIFELTPASVPPLSIQVNSVPPLNNVPRVFPTKGNISVSQNYPTY